MAELDISIVHRINSILGWLELNNPSEARIELNQLPPEIRGKPELLEVRWLVDSAEANWESALETARELLNVAPNSPEGWVHRAYAMRRVKNGGLNAAWDALHEAEAKFPQEPIIPYNLACYACQLGQFDQARELLKRAFQRGNKKVMQQMALQDPDLKALWEEIAEYR